MNGNEKYYGISKVTYINEHDETIELTDREDVIAKIMETNKRKFLQNPKTPKPHGMKDVKKLVFRNQKLHCSK